jgi:glycosyltransferase involved in cell wall biosynthesis/predicted metal-dependent phosphoesterase TrpH
MNASESSAEQAKGEPIRSRVDMHVHSTASQLSKLGIQRSLALPECATEPEEVYELAKRRGMDFVTITDHDSIAGAEELAGYPDCFISEELTAHFQNEPQAVHVLCYGITATDHEWLQAHSGSVEDCAGYVSENGITAALAHPFFAVAAPLTARHRRRLAKLFPIWETRNGARAPELNRPALIYVETNGSTGIGGSDDHAGISIGATFTETPAAVSPQAFLEHIAAGEATAGGEQGSAAKWTHVAMALAIRALGNRKLDHRTDPGSVLQIVQRVMREGNVRSGADTEDLGPQDALALLRAWLASIELEGDEYQLLRDLQDGQLTHAGLYRHARRIHERELAHAIDAVAGVLTPPPAGVLAPPLEEALAARGDDLLTHADGAPAGAPALAPASKSAPALRLADVPGVMTDLFEACLPAIPYAASIAFLGREKYKLVRHDREPRVALVADGLGGMHGVTHTVQQIRERGVPGFEVEVIGTDADVDRRLSSVAELEIPFYPGLSVGVPSLTALTDAIADGRYDLVHLVSPGPAGLAAFALAKVMEFPLVASYHTELAAYAALRSGQPELEAFVDLALGALYSACDDVLSPSPASDERLAGIGVDPERIGRWERGVDLRRFDPVLRDERLLPGEINVLYVGRQTKEKGLWLLADAFERARARDSRLHLVLAGGGPEQRALQARLGEHATFLGWQHGEDLARTYASADAFMFASSTDTFGQVILEAQASGLPVVAVDAGGPRALIEDGQTGLLVDGDATALAGGLTTLLENPLLTARLRRAALQAVRRRSWEASLEQLAVGYRRALAPRAGVARHVA